MGYATVIVSFIVCLSFNVFLNPFDVYSDISLTFNTLTFNLGDSILLSGCRFCHGKEDKDIFKYKNKSCQQCLTKNTGYRCGSSYELLNKLTELEDSDKCEDDHFSFYYNYKTKSYNFSNKTCDDRDD